MNHKALKITSRDLAGCHWHSKIKKISKKLASRLARRLSRRTVPCDHRGIEA